MYVFQFHSFRRGSRRSKKQINLCVGVDVNFPGFA